jgi:FkbM family methyltransferase
MTVKLKHLALRAADKLIVPTVFPRRRPTFYCNTVVWFPATLWQSLRSNYEVAVGMAIKKHLRDGDVFLDIGANVGWFSLFASQIVAKEGRVFAFEPAPEVFKLLLDNTANVRNIRPMQVGIGSSDQVRPFGSQGTLSSASFIEEVTKINVDYLPNTPITSVVVQVRSVDSLVDELFITPSLLKIDVEGFELEVLRGAARVLSSPQRPVLIIEIHPPQLLLSGGSEGLLFQLLRNHAYGWRVIHSNPNSLYTIVAR